MEAKERLEAVRAEVKRTMDMLDEKQGDAIIVMSIVGNAAFVGIRGNKTSVIRLFMDSVMDTEELQEADRMLHHYLFDKATGKLDDLKKEAKP